MCAGLLREGVLLLCRNVPSAESSSENMTKSRWSRGGAGSGGSTDRRGVTNSVGSKDSDGSDGGGWTRAAGIVTSDNSWGKASRSTNPLKSEYEGEVRPTPIPIQEWKIGSLTPLWARYEKCGWCKPWDGAAQRAEV